MGPTGEPGIEVCAINFLYPQHKQDVQVDFLKIFVQLAMDLFLAILLQHY